ncbi:MULTISPECIES: hypothetical protein [unclassified Clostridium]|uniref:hypothetical protein n=1 Tax=unclassified Clostridium TaxID=2614128 RepID=UPI0025B82D29|nr:MULTISPECIES: hypothetical protein [unclassified Clostridium]
MDNKRVIEIIKAGLAWANWTDEQKEAFIIAMEAVNKQIPQEVTKNRAVSLQCPKCGSIVNGRYCKNCGQRLSY